MYLYRRVVRVPADQRVERALPDVRMPSAERLETARRLRGRLRKAVR